MTRLSTRNRLDSINLDCEEEIAQRDQLYQKTMKLEAGVRHFENNNERCIKIKKTAEEKVPYYLRVVKIERGEIEMPLYDKGQRN